MAPQTITTRITYQDLLEIPDDGKQYEIIDGELYVNPSPITKHQVVVVNLSFFLRQHLRQGGGGRSFVAPFDVVFAEDTVVQPDVLVVLTERESIIGETHIEGAPSLVVEVLSERSRRRDQILKRQVYERFGVEEYWVVDPEIERVTVDRRSGNAFVRAADVERGGVLTTPLLPGFSVAVEELFVP